VREWFTPVTWQLFNAAFIALFQNLLLLLITCPAYVTWRHRHQPTNAWDMACAALFLAFLLMETIADQQQWNFQQAKKAAMTTRPVRSAARRASLASATGKARVAARGEGAPLMEGELASGFCQSGLFKYRWVGEYVRGWVGGREELCWVVVKASWFDQHQSYSYTTPTDQHQSCSYSYTDSPTAPTTTTTTTSRHPNFFAEQALWWAYHLISYAPLLFSTKTGRPRLHAPPPPYLNWTVIGPILLTLLFQGSTKLTEELSMHKYKLYKAYMKRTSRLLPWFPAEKQD
jgi:steroid 5-alpha reductase family enzyme